MPGLVARRTALLVVDMQCGFVDPHWPMAIPRAAAIAPNINKIAATMRAAAGIVVLIRHTFSDAPEIALSDWHKRSAPRNQAGNFLLSPGNPAHAIHPSIAANPNDLVVDKFRFSAFHQQSSDLRALLDSRGIDTVIVTGVASNVCCESTARDAQMSGYRVIFVRDATATFTDLEHNATLINIGRVFADVRSSSDVIAMLNLSQNNVQVCY